MMPSCSEFWASSIGAGIVGMIRWRNYERPTHSILSTRRSSITSLAIIVSCASTLRGRSSRTNGRPNRVENPAVVLYGICAENKLDAGDPAAAQSFLAKIPTNFSPTEEIWYTRFAAALYLRDYDAASRVLAAIPAEMAERNVSTRNHRRARLTRSIARARGDQQKAQAIYSAIREKMKAKWAGQPKKDIGLREGSETRCRLGTERRSDQ